MIVKYTGASDAQVNWGGNDDPRGTLVDGEIYTVERVDVHSFHTKYHINGCKYNSASFETVKGNNED